MQKSQVLVLQFSIDNTMNKVSCSRWKLTCFGPQLQLWASWTRNPRISSSSSNVIATSMSNAAGGCSRMSQASGRSGCLILMALSSANLDFAMSTLFQSRTLRLPVPLASFKGETMRVEKHVETRKRKPNWQHKWDILQEESLQNSCSYNKRKCCSENITQRCSMLSEEDPFCKGWSRPISWDSVYGGSSIHPSVATISLGEDLGMDILWQDSQTNGFANISTSNERWKKCWSTVCTPSFRCPSLTSMGDFHLELIINHSSHKRDLPSRCRSTSISNARASSMSSKSRRKSDLHTTRPEVKFIIPSQTNIQGQSSPPLSHPHSLVFQWDFSHLLKKCLGV